MGTSEKNGKTPLLYLWARCIVNFAVNLARLLFACLFALSSDDWRGSHASRRWLRLLLVARLAWVDHLFRRDTESAVARAVELAPGNAEYHTRLAALHQDAGRDAAAIESELRAAVQMNPRMSGA